jgi:hypothetical protein
MDKRMVGEQNILKALELIWRFGWLRSQEIGLFLWQPQFMGMHKFYKKNAEARTTTQSFIISVGKLLASPLALPCVTAMLILAISPVINHG